jgi:hypothetical protein
MMTKKIYILLFLTALIMTVFSSCDGRRDGPAILAPVAPAVAADSKEAVPAAPVERPHPTEEPPPAVQETGGSVTTVSAAPAPKEAAPTAPDERPRPAEEPPPVVETAAPQNTESAVDHFIKGDITALALKGSIYLGSGNYYASEGKYDVAIEHFTAAIVAFNEDSSLAFQPNPDHAMAYAQRGAVYEKLGDHDRAITDSTQAIGLNPDYTGAYNIRGLAWYYKKDYARARADWEKALQIDPDYEVARYNLEGLRQAGH